MVTAAAARTSIVLVGDWNRGAVGLQLVTQGLLVDAGVANLKGEHKVLLNVGALIREQVFQVGVDFLRRHHLS